MTRLGCVDCGAFFTPSTPTIPQGLRCPRCGGRFVAAGPRPVPTQTVSKQAAPATVPEQAAPKVLARVDLNSAKQPGASLEVAPAIIEKQRSISEVLNAPKAPRRLVRLNRRGAQAPAANVLALPANLGKHAPPVQLRAMTSARLPEADRTRIWGLAITLGVLALAAVLTVGLWPASAPLDRTIRTLQSRMARTFVAVQTPISNTLSIDPLDVEADATQGVALAHGVLHNGTSADLVGVKVEAVLSANGRPIRRRVIWCCDALDLPSIGEIGPTHPHLSRGGARRVTLERDVQETFSVLFRGIEAHHFKDELSVRLTIQKP